MPDLQRGKGGSIFGSDHISRLPPFEKTKHCSIQEKIKSVQKEYQKGLVSWEHIHQSVESWIGHAAHADTVQLRKLLLEEIIFRQERGIDQS